MSPEPHLLVRHRDGARVVEAHEFDEQRIEGSPARLSQEVDLPFCQHAGIAAASFGLQTSNGKAIGCYSPKYPAVNCGDGLKRQRLT
jgi:hypothetical protein